jgi:hypothetical protein
MKTLNIKPEKAKSLLKQILFSGIIFLFSLKSLAADYYWVGGTGDWSDYANHWATTSGGATFQTQAPTPADDVYFDSNSFSASGQSANLDIATAYCNNFNWQSTISGSDFVTPDPNNKISIFGSINIHAIFTFNGIFSFEAASSGNTVFISDTLYCLVDFNNQGGSWTLNSPIAVRRDIRIHGGTLNTNNFNVAAGSFVSDYGTPGRSLIAGTSTFSVICFDGSAGCTERWSIDNGLSFNPQNTDLYFMILPNIDTLTFAAPVFQFHNGNCNAVYRNIFCSGELINNSFVANVILQSTLSSCFKAHCLKTSFTYSIDLDVSKFSVDSVLLLENANTYLIYADDSVAAKYFKGTGSGSIYMGTTYKIEELHHYGDLIFNNGVSSGGFTFGDVHVTGDFTNNGSGSIPFNFRKLVIGGNATFANKCLVDTLMLTAGKNCSILSADTLTINNQLVAFGSSGNYIQFHSSVIGNQAFMNFPQGNVCSDYLMIKDINGIGTNIFAGANSFNLGNNAGWQFAACSTVSNVWPGDANYDLTANNLDVLNIGLAYGESGPARAGASNNWVAQPATDWSSFFQSAVNKKHADCDGNGVVDNNDTLAVSLNYGLTHPARLANQNSNQTTSPPLYLVANPDTVMEGDTVEVDIYLGTQLIPVDSIYGIAFTINFDTALVDTSWMPFDFTGSWMGTPGVDLLPYDHKLFSEGKADVALTRTDHTNIGGYGYLGKMGAVIVDNVGTRLTTAPPYVTLPLSVSNVTALTATEFYLTISTSTENVEIDTLGTTGIHSSAAANLPFSVYPNPVHKTLKVFSYWLQGEKNCIMELYNVMGEKIISKQVPVSQNRFSIDVSAVPQDMYFIKVITGKGIVNKKILVVKK